MDTNVVAVPSGHFPRACGVALSSAAPAVREPWRYLLGELSVSLPFWLHRGLWPSHTMIFGHARRCGTLRKLDMTTCGALSLWGAASIRVPERKGREGRM